MSITPLTRAVVLPDSREMPRKRFTRDQYRQIGGLGLLNDARYELIEGEIVEKMGQDRKHGVAVMLTQRILMLTYGMERIQSQLPVAPDEYNELEPDVAVLRQPVEQYDETPRPEDVLLLVEVANTSQRRDRVVKQAVYARAGVPEYWIVDVNARTLTVLSAPSESGYDSEVTYTDGDSVTPLSAPGATVAVADLLPPVPPPAP